jgi:predicted acetyltransferase
MAVGISPVTADDPRFEAFLRIAGNAHLGSRLNDLGERAAYREALRESNAGGESAFYVGELEGRVAGGFRLYDFRMRIRETECFAGGLGFVSVDLPYKQLGVAREMVLYYLRHYRERGAVMAALHAFRPDFYHRLGFGYGRKVDTYRIAPSDLPKDAQQRTYRILGPDDAAALIACYDRTFERSNGLIRKYPAAVAQQLRGSNVVTVGYERDGRIAGYVAFLMQQAKPRNAASNELIVNELVYDDPDAFRALIGFLRRQADQFAAVVVRHVLDGFHFLPADPRNDSRDGVHRVGWHETNVQSVGIMYRALGVAELFGALRNADFGPGRCVVTFDVTDRLLPENTVSVTVHFDDGRASVAGAPSDVTLRLDIAELSSLVMGAVQLRPLVEYGLVDISDASSLDLVDRVLTSRLPPICTTRF